MKIEIPIELVKTVVKELTDQINMEMEQDDPCPGIGVPADKEYPWYVELRNLLQDALDNRVNDYNLGFEFAKHMYHRYLRSEIRACDIVCPANVSDAFEEGFSDYVADIAVIEEEK